MRMESHLSALPHGLTGANRHRSRYRVDMSLPIIGARGNYFLNSYNCVLFLIVHSANIGCTLDPHWIQYKIQYWGDLHFQYWSNIALQCYANVRVNIRAMWYHYCRTVLVMYTTFNVFYRSCRKNLWKLPCISAILILIISILYTLATTLMKRPSSQNFKKYSV